MCELLLVNIVQLCVIDSGVSEVVFSDIDRFGGSFDLVKLNLLMYLCVQFMFMLLSRCIEIRLCDCISVLCRCIGSWKLLLLFCGVQVLSWWLWNMIGVLSIIEVGLQFLLNVVVQMNGLKLEFGWWWVWVVWLNLLLEKLKLLISVFSVLLWVFSEISVDWLCGIWFSSYLFFLVLVCMCMMLLCCISLFGVLLVYLVVLVGSMILVWLVSIIVVLLLVVVLVMIVGSRLVWLYMLCRCLVRVVVLLLVFSCICFFMLC